MGHPPCLGCRGLPSGSPWQRLAQEERPHWGPSCVTGHSGGGEPTRRKKCDSETKSLAAGGDMSDGVTNLGHGGLQGEAAHVRVSGVGGRQCDRQARV